MRTLGGEQLLSFFSIVAKKKGGLSSLTLKKIIYTILPSKLHLLIEFT